MKQTTAELQQLIYQPHCDEKKECCFNKGWVLWTVQGGYSD